MKKLTSKTFSNGLNRYATDPTGKVKLNTSLQLCLTAPEWVLIGSYTTKSGNIKNRYAKNPDSKPLKFIKHGV